MFKKNISPKIIVPSLGALLLVGAWLAVNPAQGFGVSFHAYTTFNRAPIPLSDIQVRSDGMMRTVSKTHDLTLQDIEWLLENKPEAVIISTGWQGMVRPGPSILQRKGETFFVLKNAEATELYNRLKKEGQKVAIHYHSTC